MNIQKGKQKRPQIHIIYGPAGIGKSTLASYYPRPLFLDTEEGSGQLDVHRVQTRVMSDLGSCFAEILAGMANEYATVVIDTSDNFWRMSADSLCAEHGWTNIETPGYGKGYTYVLQRIDEIADTLVQIRSMGFNVVLVNHADVMKMSPPDAEEFTKYTLKMAAAPNKQAAKAGQRLLEFADAVFFCHQVINTSSSGKAIGEERVIEVSPHPAWDAKNRYGLTERMPLCRESVEKILASAGMPTEAPGIPEERNAPAAATAAPTSAPTLDFDEELMVRYMRGTGRIHEGEGLESLNPKLREAIANRPEDAMKAARDWAAKQEGGQE